MGFRTRPTPRHAHRAGVLLFLLFALVPVAGEAQTRYKANPRESLAWWQLNPHLNHLWATTCMGDPSWRPGEGVSLGQAGAYVRSLQKRFGYAAIMDTIIPLYPRRRVRAVCEDAVQVDLTVGDTTRWTDVRGKVSIAANKINTGLKMRDDFLHGLIEADRYREITFQIDSVVNVQPGDTIHAVAVGVLSIKGSHQAQRIPIKAFHEADGMRVMGQVMVPASAITDVYGLSRMKLGLGVGLNLWKELHMGLDVVLVKVPPGGSNP